MDSYAFGVDIGGTSVKIGLLTEDGRLAARSEIPTRTEDQGRQIIDDICREIERIRKEALPADADLKGVGAGVPGPVEEDGTVRRCVNLGWDVFNVRDALSEALGGLPVRAGNDANVAALGEMWLGAGRGCSSMVMVTLGTGIGAGIVVDGKILYGSSGAAGEIGHLHVRDDETEVCSCGNRGCLEQYASARGLARQTEKALKEKTGGSRSVLEDAGVIDAKTIADAARGGDAFAVQRMDRLAEDLGKGLALAGCMINPDVFVIGGGLSRAGDLLLDPLERYYRKFVFHACRGAVFRAAELSNDAGICGGAKLMFDQGRL